MIANSRIHYAVICAMMITGADASAVLVTYDGGTPSRPVSVSGIAINTQIYDVTFTFNNNGALSPLRVGDLPDADIPAARLALNSLLNTQVVDSSQTVIIFQPNVDSEAPEAGVKFQTNGWLNADNRLLPLWTNHTETAGEFLGTVFDAPGTGFAQFTAVPEPSAFLCLGLVGMGLLGFKKLKQNRVTK
ncbi:PEP-CTERM sorting domain-containing protein [Bythopirellula polymerisocia]|uniref:Ice-binding protein C-terminal domain-containing protein n=1 Tax=Bythopirellula polymerisocia TaxID=2528003 RepID=A0A5C6CSM8_9BACT|nr:PEP-CTERM sorting domain-containing protein [Bythopirellula polymerisocia]TWU27560.1 hypothetical protein Pla144_23370 [Bythopirellula polymerisocia]